MDRSGRFLLLAILLMLGVLVAQPYVQERFYSATTPRSVEPRGNLADWEKTAIDIFKQTAPSVVQVAGHRWWTPTKTM